MTRNVPAVSLTGSQSGILTNDAHANARIIEPKVENQHINIPAKALLVGANIWMGRNLLGTAETTLNLDDGFDVLRSDGTTYFRARTT